MKLSLIYDFESSFWKSCQVINLNLLQAYKLSFSKSSLTHHNFPISILDYEIYKTAKTIFDENPSHIVFIGHRPPIQKLVKFLYSLYQTIDFTKRPEIVIHVFGDFTLYSAEWVGSEKDLKKFKVKFICASDKQKDLVTGFLKEKKSSIYKCPFPVDLKQFNYSQILRKTIRKKLKISDNEIVFFYSGRMSLQKKVIELIMDFINFKKITKLDAILVLSGEFDDLGNPFTGIYYRDGEFCQRYISILKELDQKALMSVKYIGNLNQKELQEHYNAADVFISMSIHNDEDYGMSPAEALLTGLPAILTDWAGYSSFKIQEKNGVSLIPTGMDDAQTRIEYSKIDLLKNLINYSNSIDLHRANRETYSKLNQQVLSIDSSARIIKKIINEKVSAFSGFTKKMDELTVAFSKSGPPFIDFKSTSHYSPFYKKVYASYLSKKL